MLSVPKFSRESEEADWWYDHRDALDRELESAAKEGRLRLVRNVYRNGKLEVVPVSKVFIPSEDLSLAERLAKSRGIRVNDFISELLHQVLLEQEAAATR